MSTDNLIWLLAAAAIGFATIAAVLLRRWYRLWRRPRGVVVSDTSVITNLAVIGLLGLLYDFYGTQHRALYVPLTVYREMRSRSKRNIGRPSIVTAAWIVPLPVGNTRRVRSLLRTYKKLDRGEAEAIILADEISSELLLMDESLGRTIATSFGLRVAGIIAVLIRAKHEGRIATVRPFLDALRGEPARFRIAQSLYEKVLRDLGER